MSTFAIVYRLFPILSALSVFFLSIQEVPAQPDLQIDNYDWQMQWVSASPCTKNPVQDYRTMIRIANSGDSTFEIISLELVGDPDAVFSISQTTIVPGLVMQPGDEGGIEVIFSPKEEKHYYDPPARVRLTYRININGKDSVGYVEGVLEGFGIESYIVVADYTFPQVEFAGPGQKTIKGEVMVKALGMRPTTLERLFLSPLTHFRIAPDWYAANSWGAAADGNVRVLNPDEEMIVDVEFSPQDAEPALKEVFLSVEGDFAIAGCPGSLSDSAGLLTGIVLLPSGVEDNGGALSSFHLHEIVPNPTNGKTRIGFRLAQRGETRVEIHDGTGRMVALLLEKGLSPGEHEVLWDGGDQAAGVYYVRIRSGAWSASRAVILVR